MAEESLAVGPVVYGDVDFGMVAYNVATIVSITVDGRWEATYNMASCSHLGLVTSSREPFSLGSELCPLLLLCRLFMGMAIGVPIWLSVRFICMGGRFDSSCLGPSEMYSAHWNWQTT